MRCTSLHGVVSAAGLALAVVSLVASAQADGKLGVLSAPDYGSGVAVGALSDSHFNTPESDGRPGVKFFTLAVQAFRKGDYRHAIDMYKVAASWAYKPAEYNLGVMYFKGEGVPVDRARGAAWMVLAAERGTPAYVHARDLMVTVLSKAEFARTDAIWNELKGTFGDAVALRRAKAQWAWVKTHQTGTRVGGAVGELRVGVLDTGRHGPPPPNAVATSSMALLRGGAMDGSVAYRQFQQSDDPYAPVFLKDRNGSVTVEPLQQVKPVHAGNATAPAKPRAGDKLDQRRGSPDLADAVLGSTSSPRTESVLFRSPFDKLGTDGDRSLSVRPEPVAG